MWQRYSTVACGWGSHLVSGHQLLDRPLAFRLNVLGLRDSFCCLTALCMRYCSCCLHVLCLSCLNYRQLRPEDRFYLVHIVSTSTAEVLFPTHSVPLERSWWPRIRWCGTGGFQEQYQCFFIGLCCSIPTIVFYYFKLFFLSVYRLVLWSWGLRTDRVYITLSDSTLVIVITFRVLKEKLV